MAEIPEAFGYQYFFTESYFHNYNLILQEREALSSAWKEYFSWNSKRYNDDYMWDSDYEDRVRAEERDITHGMMIIWFYLMKKTIGGDFFIFYC